MCVLATPLVSLARGTKVRFWVAPAPSVNVPAVGGLVSHSNITTTMSEAKAAPIGKLVKVSVVPALETCELSQVPRTAKETPPPPPPLPQALPAPSNEMHPAEAGAVAAAPTVTARAKRVVRSR